MGPGQLLFIGQGLFGDDDLVWLVGCLIMEHNRILPVRCYIELERMGLRLQQISIRCIHLLHLEMVQADRAIGANGANGNLAADCPAIVPRNQNDRRVCIQVGKLKPGSG